MNYGQDVPEEKCTVCQFEFEATDHNIVSLSRCTGTHFFHAECIEDCRQNKLFVKCPNCFIIYGKYFGNMPHGTMTVNKDPTEVSGYPGCGCIVVNYAFPSQSMGTVRVAGIQRTAYLPDNSEGNKVLTLLVRAFQSRITFRVGTSVTTGRENAIVWNGIHHKTAVQGGTQYFGYPDPTYLERVTEELKAAGII